MTAESQATFVGQLPVTRRSLRAILAMVFVYLLGRSMSLPIIPSFYESSNLSVTDIGIVLGSFAAAFLLSEAGWGFVSDKLRRRSSIFLLIAGSSLTSLVYTRPQQLWVLIVVQLFSALCLGGIGLFPRLTISGVVDPRSRGSSFGYLGLVFAVGPMGGALLGAVVSSLVGLAYTFVAVTVVSIFALIPLYFVDFTQRPGSRSTSADPQGSTATNEPEPMLGRLKLLAVGAVGLTYSTASSFYVLLFPNILTQEASYHASVVEIATVISVFSLSSGVLQPLMVRLASKHPRRWVVGGLIGCGATFFLLLGYHALLDVDIISLAAGASVAVTAPLALMVLSSGVPGRTLGRALGLFGAAEDFGIIVGGSLGTFVWAIAGPGAAIALLGTQCVFVGTLAAFALRGKPRRSSPA